MGRNTNSFFENKHAWSIVKDDLLACYLKPYIAKIIHTGKPTLCVDCFAGKGKFNDGSNGSPIIIKDIINSQIAHSNYGVNEISLICIEKNHCDELKNNLSVFKNVECYEGLYEEKIHEVLKNKQGYNLFLYVDPYGIKSLDYKILKNLLEKDFNSIEILINFNAYGFFRCVCQFVKALFPCDIEEISVDDFFDIPYTEQEQWLTDVAGGDYWKEIISDYNNHNIDACEAEERIIGEYCNTLKKDYNYVLNMQIRSSIKGVPKYNMIHITNHKAGCVLMADNMYRREELSKKILTGGQGSLFDDDETAGLEENLLLLLKENRFISLTEFEAKFFTKHGVVCNSTDIHTQLKELEKRNKVVVMRDPKQTKTGKESSFWSESKGKKVSLEIRK